MSSYKIGPIYDSKGSWQSDQNSLLSSSVQANIDTSSFSTQHYAFLSGEHQAGAVGIAYLGTTCLRLGNGKNVQHQNLNFNILSLFMIGINSVSYLAISMIFIDRSKVQVVYK